MMDRLKFIADIEATPQTLRNLADQIKSGGLRWPFDPLPQRILLTGMGSSWFAAQVIAGRLRSRGLNAVAELASCESSWPITDKLTVIAISASGESVEVLEICDRYKNAGKVIALTNNTSATVCKKVSHVVDMFAQTEQGGIACRSYRHTLAALLALESQLCDDLNIMDIVKIIRAAADATEDLLERREIWLRPVIEVLEGGSAVWMLAPLERISSSLQGALMIREGPRQLAVGCETGDWSHVDVYLTKSLDYRALLFTGSRYDKNAVKWMRERGSRFVAVGADVKDAAATVRFVGDDNQLVALLTEVLVAELVAATWWT